MNDIFCVAAFAAKVLCLFVFVSVLKPDGSIGAAWTPTSPADCTKASGNTATWAGGSLQWLRKPASVMRVREACTAEKRSARRQSS